ncbi:hypothetical protein ACFROC_25710 [Nocardia tengchongensis]|uniref:hypothetical protein n=1 Tax=Nocardia tengchongensis TaxID=2055889 RepID=UPI00368EA894
MNQRVDTYLASAAVNSTARTYASAWRRFTAWCEETGRIALPATAHTVIRYLTAASETSIATSTLEVWRAAIARIHVEAGLLDPTADPTFRREWRALRRSHSRVHAEETADAVPAVTVPMITAMVQTAHEQARTWRQQVAARRDIALLLLMYDAGRRRSEIAELTIGDLDIVTGSEALLRIRMRNNQTRDPDTHYIYRPRGTSSGLTCPWCALARWLDVVSTCDSAVSAAHTRCFDDAAVTDAASIAVQRLLRRDTSDPHEHRCTTAWIRGRLRAPLFRPLSHGGLPHFDTPLTARSTARVITARASAAGLGALPTHSLRAGVVTHLLDTGTGVDDIMALTGHKRAETILRYDRRRAQPGSNAPTGL